LRWPWPYYPLRQSLLGYWQQQLGLTQAAFDIGLAGRPFGRSVGLALLIVLAIQGGTLRRFLCGSLFCPLLCREAAT
jgi:hypothetical protein